VQQNYSHRGLFVAVFREVGDVVLDGLFLGERRW
jgi:hypothetical protein